MTGDKIGYGALGAIAGVFGSLAGRELFKSRPPARIQEYVSSLQIEINPPDFEGQVVGRPTFLMRTGYGPRVYNYWYIPYQSQPAHPKSMPILGIIMTWSGDLEETASFSFFSIAGALGYDIIDMFGNSYHVDWCHTIGPTITKS
jgi:hypothetical protein